MFYYLNGELTLHDPGFVVVECGGVGYRLTVSLLTAESLGGKVGQKVRLYTYLSVREDGVELFGFGSEAERRAFGQLTGVSGVGPKAAMAILSVLSPDRLALAICTEDIKGIARAQGVGNKTAARIVLELKDKMSRDFSSGTPLTTGGTSQTHPAISGNLSEATEALMSLGYDKNSVLGALRGISPDTEVGEIIRRALKALSNA